MIASGPRAGVPDVVVLDLNLPDLRGEEVDGAILDNCRAAAARNLVSIVLGKVQAGFRADAILKARAAGIGPWP